MLNKQFCVLKKNLDIKNLFHKGRFISNSLLIFKYQNNNLNKTRFAISVNKKIFRTAVIRNKIKRQIRHIMRELNEYKSVDILIIIKNGYLSQDFLDIKKSFESLYNKIK